MKKRNKLILSTLLLSILCSCNNNNLVIWNKTFRSNGKTYVNWSDKLDNTNITYLNLIKDNFTNIDFSNSYYIYYIYGEEKVIELEMPFSTLAEEGFPLDSFENFKSAIDTWWENDVDYDPYTSFSGFKTNIDKCTFKFTQIGQLEGVNKGNLVMSFPDPVKQKGTQHDDYYCLDATPEQKGNYLNLYKDQECKTQVGYVEELKLSNGEKILIFRTGYNDETCIDFHFSFKKPVSGISKFVLTSYICIKEYKPFPVWAMIVIPIGGVALIGGSTAFIISKRKQHKKPQKVKHKSSKSK